MSGKVKGAAAADRVSIPSTFKKTIATIKEFTGQNHSDDEIYAMLKECSMDPNETTQKLLLLDTFHEVKRKRDRKKENTNKESVELKWETATQARPNRPSRGNYPSRHISHDAGGGRHLTALKENVINPHLEKGAKKAPLAGDKIGTSVVASSVLSNGPDTTLGSAVVKHEQSNETVNTSLNISEGPLRPSPPISAITNSNVPSKNDTQQKHMADNPIIAAPILPAADSRGHFSSSDPILLPSKDLPLHSAVGTIGREMGIQLARSELIADNPSEKKSTPSRNSSKEVSSFNMQQKTSGVGKNHHLEPASSTTVSRPSSNYANRSQVNGPHKVGPGKEWKPKSTSSSISQVAVLVASSEVPFVSTGTHPESQSAPTLFTSSEETSELQRKLEESHISDRKHVIIPNHLHVPEAEKLGFCFGSFDAHFELKMDSDGVPGSDKNPPFSESSEATEEAVDGLQSSNHNAYAAAEESEIPDQSQSPLGGPESYPSGMVEISSSIPHEYSEPKQDTPGNHLHPVVHTSSNYNFDFMPQIPTGQFSPLESPDSQARDAPRFPGFVVQQPFDPAGYYAQFYRTGIDNDGQISPFHTAGATNKYNGNATLVSPQNPQSQEVISTSPTPGVTQSSITSQQPFPVLRHPTGVHLPHYPQNYIPYGPYFSPFYVPQPTIHQFLSNNAFPQHQAANLYPTPTGTTNAKYPVSQYKHTENSTQIGSYAPYGVPIAANYASSSAPTAVTSSSNEDPQAKENNIYASGHESESSGGWYTNATRDIPMQAAPGSFYNFPQAQLSFSPPQPGLGAYFHPSQATTVHHSLLQQSQPISSPPDHIVGPTGNVYQQQSQHTHWPSNY